MKLRAHLVSLCGLAALVAFALAFAFAPSSAQIGPARSYLTIATGGTSGTYFPIGQAIALIVSHPRGVERCAHEAVCGPPGLIASARTSAGAVANVLSVNRGQVTTALAQSDVVSEALAGTGSFVKAGKQTHVRAIANLFPEPVHVVASVNARIKSVSDLRGKRVSIDDPNSGTAATALSVLGAYRISKWRVKISHVSADVAAQQMQTGKLDAFFFVGGAPMPVVRDLIARGKATLVPIDGAGRKRLLASKKSLSSAVIVQGTYPNTGNVETVGARAIWIVSDSAPNDMVYGVTRALFNRANRQLLVQSHPSARAITLSAAPKETVAPLHPGAARYYREVGLLKN
ncbi:MAG: TAXI family TRAP transporter solute-binding subunit [Alphaproteobacteria bacterium]|nr:TAXI family TRAP transporter solute-binding subunit [Alphaproteobacteria bacterium]